MNYAIALYQAYYGKNPKIIMGSKMHYDFNKEYGKPTDKSDLKTYLGCYVSVGNFEFGFILE